MTDVIKILEKTEGLKGYKINEYKKTSYELFFVHKSLETVRSTDTTTTDVTVYVEHDGAVGDSNFPVFESMSDDDIREKIKTAAARAMLVSNQPYELPAGGELEALHAHTEEVETLSVGLGKLVYHALGHLGIAVDASHLPSPPRGEGGL